MIADSFQPVGAGGVDGDVAADQLAGWAPDDPLHLPPGRHRAEEPLLEDRDRCVEVGAWRRSEYGPVGRHADLTAYYRRSDRKQLASARAVVERAIGAGRTRTGDSEPREDKAVR